MHSKPRQNNRLDKLKQGSERTFKFRIAVYDSHSGGLNLFATLLYFLYILWFFSVKHKFFYIIIAFVALLVMLL